LLGKVKYIMRCKCYLLILIIFILLAYSISCTPKLTKDTIAFVDGTEITKNDLFRWRSESTFKNLSDTMKNAVVKQYIDKIVIKNEIDALGLIENDEVLDKIFDWKRKTLTLELYQKDVVGYIINKKKLRQLYNDLELEKNISVIFIRYTSLLQSKVKRSKAEAEELINDIYKKSQAIEFSLLARKYSDRINTSKDSWKIGWITRDSGLDPGIEEVVWNLDVGEISKPLKIEGGYAIVKINAERKKDMLSFERELPNLKKIAIKIYGAEIQSYYSEYLSKILEENGFVIDTLGLENFFDDYNSKVLKLDDSQKKSKNAYSIVEKIRKPIYLGSYKDTKINRAWLLKNLKYRTEITTPLVFRNKYELKKLISYMASLEMMYNRAISYGMDKNPSYIHRFENFKSETVFKKFMEEYVDKKAIPTEEQLRKYYDDNRHKYLTKEKVRIQEIVVSDKNLLMEIYDKIQNGIDFTKLAKKYNESKRSKTSDGELPPLKKEDFNSNI